MGSEVSRRDFLGGAVAGVATGALTGGAAGALTGPAPAVFALTLEKP